MRVRKPIRMHAALVTSVLVVCGVVPATVADPTIYRVDCDAAPGGNGLSWPTAFQTLQGALNVAGDEDMIWVAEGTYIPTEMFNEPDERSKTFQIEFNVKICGGFQGGETSLSQRDPETNTTILSGALVTDQRVYHVVRIDTGVGPAAHLSGFRIESGQANHVGDDASGGGLFIHYSGPVISRCLIWGNEAFPQGGGMYVKHGGPQGAPYIVDCTIMANSAPFGGGVAASTIAPPLTDTEFVNCLFTGNEATVLGGAYYGGLAGRVSMTNCTISENAALSLYSYGGGCAFDISARAAFRNSILWRNSDRNGMMDESSQLSGGDGNTADPEHVSVEHSCVHGLDVFAGNGNIDDDPLFAAPPPPGFGNFRLTGLSPCKDVGDQADVPPDSFDVDDDGNTNEPTPDLDLNRRIVAGEVDMGAYEFFCQGDANDDGAVDVLDLLALFAAWGPCEDCLEDLNHDGVVDVQDLLMLFADWGCPTHGEPPPQEIQDCFDRYSNDLEKLMACIEAVLLTEGQ